MHAIGAFSCDAINIYNNALGNALQYKSVADYNENNWKSVSIDGQDESRKFLNQKPLKLWQKYRGYIGQFDEPRVEDWLMYDHFNDTDLMWLKALNAFNERVLALKRIEKQSK